MVHARWDPPRFLPTGHGGEAHVRPWFIRLDICSICAAAERAEPADAIPGLRGADDCPPVRDDPLAVLAWDVAAAIADGSRQGRRSSSFTISPSGLGAAPGQAPSDLHTASTAPIPEAMTNGTWRRMAVRLYADRGELSWELEGVE